MASPLVIVNSTSREDWHDLPTVISETLVHRFVYWNRSLQVGMRYGTELYTLLKSYAVQERLQASDTACRYAAQGIEVCITVSPKAYSVWISLQSLNKRSELIDSGSSPGRAAEQMRLHRQG